MYGELPDIQGANQRVREFMASVAASPAAVALLVLLLASREPRQAPRASLALGCFALPTVLTILASDMALKQHFVLIYRYEMPVWLALQLAVAGSLAWNISRSTGAARATWGAIAVVLLVACGASSALAIGESTFWDSWYDAGTPEIAAIVNALPHPLILVDHDSDNILTFAGAMRPDVRIRFSKWNTFALPRLPPGASPNTLVLTAAPIAPHNLATAPHSSPIGPGPNTTTRSPGLIFP